MKEHCWTKLLPPGQIDLRFWLCRECGTSAGRIHNLEAMAPAEMLDNGFLSGTPLRNLGNDCDVAKQKVDDWVVKHPEYLPVVQKERGLESGQVGLESGKIEAARSD